jgi:predicted dehydrogenase
VQEGERLLEEVEAKKARVLIGHHRAHGPNMAKAKAIVGSGALGRIVAVIGACAFLKPDHYFDDGPWRREPGGGPILINMIHEVHNLRMLCGEITEVQAISSNAVRGFKVEDTVAISLRFRSGALGSFLLSDVAASARNWEHTSRENPAYPYYDDEDSLIVCGTHGSLAVPTMRMKSYPNEAGRSWWKPFRQSKEEVRRDDPLRLQMLHFAEVVRGEAEPKVSARDGLANLRVTEAIVEAARSGRTVVLP